MSDARARFLERKFERQMTEERLVVPVASESAAPCSPEGGGASAPGRESISPGRRMSTLNPSSGEPPRRTSVLASPSPPRPRGSSSAAKATNAGGWGGDDGAGNDGARAVGGSSGMLDPAARRTMEQRESEEGAADSEVETSTRQGRVSASRVLLRTPAVGDGARRRSHDRGTRRVSRNLRGDRHRHSARRIMLCTHDSRCPLPRHGSRKMCILHATIDGKSGAEIMAALAALERAVAAEDGLLVNGAAAEERSGPAAMAHLAEAGFDRLSLRAGTDPLRTLSPPASSMSSKSSGSTKSSESSTSASKPSQSREVVEHGGAGVRVGCGGEADGGRTSDGDGDGDEDTYSDYSGSSCDEALPADDEPLDTVVPVTKRVVGGYLKFADLSRVSLDRTVFVDCDMRGCSMRASRLFKCSFPGSDLDASDFSNATLERTDLSSAGSVKSPRLHATILDAVRLPPIRAMSPDGSGRLRVHDGPGPSRDLAKARAVYRALKECYRAAGENGDSGSAYVYEMDCKRLSSPFSLRIMLTVLWATCGYGEKLGRLFAVSVIQVILFAFLFSVSPLVAIEDGRDADATFFDAMFLSMSTFTTLGSGEVQPRGIARLWVALESLMGAFSMALIVFVFTRGMLS